jgi:hypothetical protein
MTHSQINFTLSDLLTEMVTQSGFDILPELVHNPGEINHEFRNMPTTDSGGCRPLIPA